MAKRTMLGGIIACCLGALLTLEVPSTGRANAAPRAQAELSSDALPVAPYAGFIAEASHRFAIPEHWIRAVMQVESGGNAQAISSRGALGLMQIMPKTWLELSVRYDLGIDPFDPHDNITAGTAYLREMLDRFGSEGFLAAYNAGPRRYEEHLVSGRPLPDETRTYVARLAPLIGIEQHDRDTSAVRHIIPWQQSAIFVERSDGSSADGLPASAKHFIDSSKAVPQAGALALVPGARGLFVRRSSEVQSR